MQNNVKPLTQQQLSTANKLARVVWQLSWLILYRPSPVPFHAWRRFLWGEAQFLCT